MIQIGHETAIRQQLGFIPVAHLWGPGSSCLIVEGGLSVADIPRLLHQNPEAVREQLKLPDGAIVLLLDELLAHAKFSVAADLAAYIAATLGLTRGWSRDWDQYAQVYLRLKCAQAAMESSAHRRARSVLLQVKTLCAALPSGALSSLLQANFFLLSGRLSQLSFLTQRSKTRLEEARAAFEVTDLGVPGGFDLLFLRNEMDVDPSAVSEKLQSLDSTRIDTRRGHVLGEYAHHYLTYLRARAAEALWEWADATRGYAEAAEVLALHAHAGHADPIRLGYSLLGQGRSLIELGLSERLNTAVDEGLGLLLKARWLFKGEAFSPGEYLAYHAYSVAKSKIEKDHGLSLQRAKEVNRLAVRSRIIPFQIEAGYAYATALYAQGRIAITRSLLKDLERIVEDPIADEVKARPTWRHVCTLVKRVENARQNGVDPLELWGVSEYAQRERDFVNTVVDPQHPRLVSVFGQQGCGRRILIARVARARGQTGELHLLYGEKRTAIDVIEEYDREFAAGSSIVLYDFDRWMKDVQIAVYHHLRKAPDTRNARTYVTLTTPLIGTDLENQLAPGLSDALYPGHIELAPLQSRGEDTLLLARGFLIRALLTRGVSGDDAGNLLFTGDACRFILQTYLHITDLNQAMRYLASKLDMRRDVIVESMERSRIPGEVLRRELRPRTVEQPRESKTQKSPRGRKPISKGPEILIADRAQVIDLCHRWKGKFAPMAFHHGIPRSTLIKRWTETGMITVWREARAARGYGGEH